MQSLLKKHEEIFRDYKGVQQLPYYTKQSDKTISFIYPLKDFRNVSTVFNYWWVLNELTDNHRAFLVGIGDADIPLEDQEIKIPSDIIEESDIIVLPFTSQDLTVPNGDEPNIYEIIKSFNPDCKIFYQVDFDCFNINNRKVDHKRFKLQLDKDSVINNLREADKAIFSNEQLYHYLFEELSPKLKGSGTKLDFTFPMFNQAWYEDVEEEKSHDPTKPFRLGIYGGQDQSQDIKSVNKYLISLKEDLGDKLEIYVYGKDCNSLKKSLSGVDHIFMDQTTLDNFFKEIASLELNAILMPVNPNDWNRNHFDLTLWMHFAAIGVPAIVPDIDPINKFVKTEENGFIYEDKDKMVEQIKILVDMDRSSKSVLSEAAKMAHNTVVEYYSVQKATSIDFIKDLFVC